MGTRLRIDPFTAALAATVVLATVLPVRGAAAQTVRTATDVGIALLFFLHGARLSREAVIAGAGHVRLHLLVLASTFVLFPLLGLALGVVAPVLLTPDLYVGVLFLCALPSTVQSSIAFTAIAGGNVAAAICSASASNLLGVVLTPLLVRLLLSTGAASTSGAAIRSIVMLLLVPFVVGHLARPWLRKTVERHQVLLSTTDRATILLVVYGAFSASVVEGLWHRIPARALVGTVLVSIALLAAVLGLTTLASRRLGFSREDEIAIVFCGSKKSLASGVPMANVIFAGDATLGAVVLPLMVFHQIQLVTCAFIAARRQRETSASAPP